MAVAFLALYLGTLTVAHRFDAIAFYLAAQTADLARLLHPHHILYLVFAHGVFRVVGPDRLELALQVISAFAASAALGLVVLLLDRVVRHPGWAVGGACLLGVSGGFWMSATEMDMYALAVASVAAGLVCYARADQTSRAGWYAAAGVCVGIGVLFHQLVGLLLLAGAVAILTVPPVRASRALAAFATPGAVLALGGYVAGYLVRGRGSRASWATDVPAGLVGFLTTYGYGGRGPFARDRVVDVMYGVLYAVAPGAAGLVPTWVIRTVTIVVVAGLVWAIARWVRAVIADRRVARVVFAVIVWIGMAIVANAALAPTYVGFWTLILPGLVMVVTAAYAHAAVSLRGPWPRIAAGAFGVLILGLAGANYVRVVWPRTIADNDVDRRVAHAVLTAIPSQSAVIVPVSVAAEIIAERLGREQVHIVPHLPEVRSADAELAELRRFIARHRAAGRPVYVFSTLFVPPSASAQLGDAAFRRSVQQVLRDALDQSEASSVDTVLLESPRRRHPLDRFGSAVSVSY